MRIRDSGMPDEAYWESLFDVPLILSRLGITHFQDVAELGCGYGTFSIPVATAIKGTLYTFDVDPIMIARTKARAGGLPIVCEQRDVMELGFGVKVDAVLLFNILHCEQPGQLLQHAREALRKNGQVLVIHWRYGETPRGPSLDIRPRPEQAIEWAKECGLQLTGEVLDLSPWHYGLRFSAASSEGPAEMPLMTRGS
jgi:SAM-dependent methyltransferase